MHNLLFYAIDPNSALIAINARVVVNLSDRRASLLGNSRHAGLRHTEHRREAATGGAEVRGLTLIETRGREQDFTRVGVKSNINFESADRAVDLDSALTG